MARKRPRRAQRNVLVFLGSLAAHIGLYFLLASEFRFFPPPPYAEEPVAIEVVPAPIPIPPPPPPPVPRVKAPQPQPPAPQPQPQPQPQPKPQAQPTQAQPKPAPAPAAKESGLVREAVNPTPQPTPKPAPSPSPLAPPVPSPQPGPPQSVPKSALVQSQAVTANSPRSVKLRKREEEQAAGLVSGANLPQSFSLPTLPGGATASTGPPAGGAAPGGGAPGRFPQGGLPNGFGNGWGMARCVNPLAHLTQAEQAKCAERLGENATTAPHMDAIGATRRASLNDEAAKEAATQKYLNSMPAATAEPIPGQPRALQQPTQ